MTIDLWIFLALWWHRSVQMLMNKILNCRCACLHGQMSQENLGNWKFLLLDVWELTLFVFAFWPSFVPYSIHIHILIAHSSLHVFLFSLPYLLLGLSQDKLAIFIKRLRAEPRYLLAQNVSTCIDPLEVCLHRQTVQDTVHIFQHSIPTEGKPITNQKNSGRT